MMFNRFRRCSIAMLAPVVFLAGCGHSGEDVVREYQMGDRIGVGPLTFNVVETVWRSQLGDELKTRIPDNRFLLIDISATNGGGHDISVPLFTLEGSNGTTYKELEDGEGVDRWFGLLRTLNPAQTQQGQLLFDVPLGTYRLKLTDGGETGTEHTAWVTIPLHMEPESPLTDGK
jgi:Domain of unknown function (DUF4352)